MNFGAPTPIEVAMSGPNLAASRGFAEKALAELKKIPALRDLQFGLPLDYPTADIRIDHKRAGQLDLTVEQVARSVVAATSSSRYTQPVYWRDPASGTAYQVQVEIPQARMASIEDLQSVPVNPHLNSGAETTTLVGAVAEIGYGTMAGEYDRYNQQRMVTITANIAGQDLGSVANEVNAAMAMIAGMVPMALALGEGGEQTAPLGRAVIGGLAASTLATLTILPLVFGVFQRKAGRASASLHPKHDVSGGAANKQTGENE